MRRIVMRVTLVPRMEALGSQEHERDENEERVYHGFPPFVRGIRWLAEPVDRGYGTGRTGAAGGGRYGVKPLVQ